MTPPADVSTILASIQRHQAEIRHALGCADAFPAAMLLYLQIAGFHATCVESLARAGIDVLADAPAWREREELDTTGRV